MQNLTLTLPTGRNRFSLKMRGKWFIKIKKECLNVTSNPLRIAYLK